MKTNKSSPEVRQIIQDIRGAYVPTMAYDRLDEYFDQLLEQRRADLAEGIVSDLRGIVLVGRSGAGKTTAIQELRRRYRKRLVYDDPDGVNEMISLKVPSPATMKFVATAALHAAGYPLVRDRSAAVIWGLVKQQFKLRKTLFMDMDEAQDLAQHQTDKERQAIVNTLKSLMENSQWPVGLVLTGMPGLKSIINQDAQLARRMYPIEIERLSPYAGQDQVLARLGYPAAAHCDTTGAIRGCETEIGHKLTRIAEPVEVPHFGHDGDGDNECNTAHGLDRLHHGRQLPVWQQLGNLPGQLRDPRLGIADRIHIVLKHDLLRGVVKAHCRQPAPVGDRPRPPLLPRIDAAVAQQEALQVLSRLASDAHRCRAGAHQVAHGLMRRIPNPDRGQLARPVQLRQHDGITAVRLHAVTSLHGDQRRRDDRAIVPQLDKLAVQAIATGPGLVAEMKPTADSAQLVDQFSYMVGPVQNRPQWRTSPPCATATEIVALWTSSTMNMLSCVWSLPHP